MHINNENVVQIGIIHIIPINKMKYINNEYHIFGHVSHMP